MAIAPERSTALQSYESIVSRLLQLAARVGRHRKDVVDVSYTSLFIALLWLEDDTSKWLNKNAEPLGARLAAAYRTRGVAESDRTSLRAAAFSTDELNPLSYSPSARRVLAAAKAIADDSSASLPGVVGTRLIAAVYFFRNPPDHRTLLEDDWAFAPGQWRPAFVEFIRASRNDGDLWRAVFAPPPRSRFSGRVSDSAARALPIRRRSAPHHRTLVGDLRFGRTPAPPIALLRPVLSLGRNTVVRSACRTGACTGCAFLLACQQSRRPVARRPACARRIAVARVHHNRGRGNRTAPSRRRHPSRQRERRPRRSVHPPASLLPPTSGNSSTTSTPIAWTMTSPNGERPSSASASPTSPPTAPTIPIPERITSTSGASLPPSPS